jgi:hypothetical protein
LDSLLCNFHINFTVYILRAITFVWTIFLCHLHLIKTLYVSGQCDTGSFLRTRIQAVMLDACPPKSGRTIAYKFASRLRCLENSLSSYYWSVLSARLVSARWVRHATFSEERT